MDKLYDTINHSQFVMKKSLKIHKARKLNTKFVIRIYSKKKKIVIRIKKMTLAGQTKIKNF